jgi:hypothetical protein
VRGFLFEKTLEQHWWDKESLLDNNFFERKRKGKMTKREATKDGIQTVVE